jgi:FixJ family two-component response regulator
MVCVVDDDISIRESVAGALQLSGYDVRTFESAETFLRAESPGCACLILDVTMPGMSGVELQERLLTAGRAPPIVFITARADAVLEARVMARGAVRFLRKPLEEDRLLEAVDAALHSASLLRLN